MDVKIVIKGCRKGILYAEVRDMKDELLVGPTLGYIFLQCLGRKYNVTNSNEIFYYLGDNSIVQ